jgi:hypothetical protein
MFIRYASRNAASETSVLCKGHFISDTCNFVDACKGYFTHTMPRPCRSPAMPCHCGIRSCPSHLIYTVRPCLIDTCHATTMQFLKRLLKTTAQRGMGVTYHGMCELASAVQRRHVGDLPAVGFFRLPRGVSRRLLSEAYQSVKR